MTWVAVTTGGSGTWTATAGVTDDWLNISLSPRLTEDGQYRRTEDGLLRVIEGATAGPVSTWVAV